MKFKMNDTTYEIVEKNNIAMDFANGKTDFINKKIILNNKLSNEIKRRTLIRELTYVYVREFVSPIMLEKISINLLICISEESHDIIHKIVDEYFRLQPVTLEMNVTIDKDILKKLIVEY